MTGYISNMLEHKQDFRAFMLSIAHCFFYDSDMNDGFEKPMVVDPHTYEHLAEAEEQLAAYRALTPVERTEAAIQERRKQTEDLRASIEKARSERATLQAMLEQVTAWTPPSDQHVRLKQEAIDQLTSSMPSLDWQEKAIVAFESRTAEEMIAATEKDLEETIQHRRSQIQREEARCAQMNAWVEVLKGSLTRLER